jgi:Fe-S-cluster containining protein
VANWSERPPNISVRFTPKQCVGTSERGCCYPQCGSRKAGFAELFLRDEPRYGLQVSETPTKPPHFECDQCGACCRTFPVLVSAEDALIEPRIKSEALELPGWVSTPTWRFQLNPLPFCRGCTFLNPDDLCGVYATRPHVCREFSAGSPECQEARSREGIPPLVENLEPPGDSRNSLR